MNHGVVDQMVKDDQACHGDFAVVSTIEVHTFAPTCPCNSATLVNSSEFNSRMQLHASLLTTMRLLLLLCVACCV